MGKISTYTVTDDALTDLILGDTSAPTTVRFAKDRTGGFFDPGRNDYRLSLLTNVAVPTTDQAAQSTLYLTPYLGNRLSVFDATRWRLVAPGQLSLGLSGLTAGKNYDAFVDWNAGTPAVVLGPAWTNDTTRATALTTQDAVAVLTGTTTSRYLGTIRATAATTTEDTLLQRYVWNAYNPVPRRLYKRDGTGHTYATNTVRQWNATAANKVEFVIGLAGAALDATHTGDTTLDGTSGFSQTGAALDSTSAFDFSTHFTFTGGAIRLQTPAVFQYIPAVGYHFLAILENSIGGTNTYNSADVSAVLFC